MAATGRGARRGNLFPAGTPERMFRHRISSFWTAQTSGGADMRNLLTKHNLTVERYSDTSEYNSKLEALVRHGGP